MQIKATVTTHPQELSKWRKSIPAIGKYVEQLELSHSANTSVNWYYHFGKQLAQ